MVVNWFQNRFIRNRCSSQFHLQINANDTDLSNTHEKQTNKGGTKKKASVDVIKEFRDVIKEFWNEKIAIYARVATPYLVTNPPLKLP